MKLRNKKTGGIGICNLRIVHSSDAPLFYNSLAELNEDWEDDKPVDPLIKDEKIRKVVREWANYNKTESVYIYNLVFDHGGVCIENSLVRFYDPILRSNIDIWFKTKAPTFKEKHEYTIKELCGEKQE